MTNSLALWLGAILVAALLADWLLIDGQVTIFVLRKLLNLIDWMKFWA